MTVIFVSKILTTLLEKTFSKFCTNFNKSVPTMPTRAHVLAGNPNLTQTYVMLCYVYMFGDMPNRSSQGTGFPNRFR